jgi:hypothetical protein
MTQAAIKIKESDGIQIGAIIFDETPQKLEVQRTATGINLRIPAELNLKWPDRSQPRPHVSNVRAVVLLVGSPKSEIEVARVRDDDYYEAASPQKTVPLDLLWTDALPALIYIEQSRLSERPQLEIRVQAELAYVVVCPEAPEPSSSRTVVRPLRYEVLTSPKQRIHDKVLISYPLDVWEAMIRTAFEASRDDPYLLTLPLRSFLKPKGSEE